MRQAGDEAGCHRITDIRENDGNAACNCLHRRRRGRCDGNENVGMQIDEIPGKDGQLDRPFVGIPPVNGKIFAFDIAQLPKLFSKTVELGEILFVTSQYADVPYALGLLRARR
jgi:hypothetical protein